MKVKGLLSVLGSLGVCAAMLFLIAATDVTIVTKTVEDSDGNTVVTSKSTKVKGRDSSGNELFSSESAGSVVPGLVVKNSSGTPGATPAAGTAYFNADIKMATGKDVVIPLAILTPGAAFPTPATGIPLPVGQVSRVVAGAPTANHVQLPLATASVGKNAILLNESAQPVAIVAQGTDTCNAATANTPCSCAANKICECIAPATGLWKCGSK